MREMTSNDARRGCQSISRTQINTVPTSAIWAKVAQTPRAMFGSAIKASGKKRGIRKKGRSKRNGFCLA